MSSPFLSAAACAATSAASSSEPTAVPVKRLLDTVPVVISGQCRGRARGWLARRRAGTRPSIGRARARAALGCRSTTRRVAGSPRAPPRHPSPGGSACSPARSTTTTVARSRVSSSRATSTCWRPRPRRAAGTASRPGAVQRFERVGSDRRRPRARSRSSSPRARRCPSTAASTSASRSARRRDDLAALLPRIAGDDEQHPVEPQLRLARRRRRRHDRRAPGRTCPPKTPIRSVTMAALARPQGTAAACGRSPAASSTLWGIATSRVHICATQPSLRDRTLRS